MRVLVVVLLCANLGYFVLAMVNYLGERAPLARETDRDVAMELDVLSSEVVSRQGKEATTASLVGDELDHVEPACMVLGVFERRELVEQMRARLANIDGLDVASDSMRFTESLGHWVYLVAPQTPQGRKGLVDRLVADGIEDYYVLMDPRVGGAISLGLYAARANAQRRAAQIRALGGYEPMVGRRYRDREVFWLQLAGSSTGLADAVALLESAADMAPPGLKWSPSACDEVRQYALRLFKREQDESIDLGR